METNRMETKVRALRIAGGAIALATGAILGLSSVFTLGCGPSEEAPPQVSAADPYRDTRDTRETTEPAADYMKQQMEDLEFRVEQVLNQAEDDIDRARDHAGDLPEEAKGGIEAAIQRTETARDRVNEEMSQLQDAGAAQWEANRQRVMQALDELDQARREVTAAIGRESTTG